MRLGAGAGKADPGADIAITLIAKEIQNAFGAICV